MSTLYAVGMSTILRVFWNTLSAKDAAKYGKLMRVYGAAIVIGPFILTSFEWAKGRLSLLWREALTETYMRRFFSADAIPFYRVTTGISSAPGRHEIPAIDNSDQRLSEDVRTFTERAVRFLCVFGVAIFDLSIFSVLLFRIYPPLFLTLIFYSLLGTILVSVYGRPLLGMNAAQLQREADYRFALLRVRDNAESIAFYRGGGSEKAESLRRFGRLYENAMRLLGKTRNVSLVSTSHRYWVQVIPTLILGPAYFAGTIALGTISQALYSFNHVLSSMGLIIAEFVALSQFGAGVRRLDTLASAIDEIEEDAEVDGDATRKIQLVYTGPSELPRLVINDLYLHTPSAARRPLVQDLSLVVDPGRRLLLAGVSGVGKTSLLRAIAGLWRDGVGKVTRPADTDTLFLPQRPFLSVGSLRENIVYPLEGDEAASISDEAVLSALDRVNLPKVADRMGGLDAPGEEIGRRLSLGEQQRLAFARIITSRPKFLVLDESTSALDEDNERLMYSIVGELNITCVSVGNQASLRHFHDLALRLEPDGSWTLTRLN